MITIPTYDLVTGLRNVTDFAPSIRVDRQRSYVRLACTGDALEMSAYAVTHGAIYTWRPEHPVAGGLDDPWEVLLSTTQCKRLTRTFEIKSGAYLTPVTLDVRGDTLTLSRPGDAENGVEALRQSFQGSLEADLPRPEKEFAGLGERSAVDPVLSNAVAVAVGAACKRTDLYAVPVALERGVRVQIGGELVVLARYPMTEDDTQAIVDAAVDDL